MFISPRKSIAVVIATWLISAAGWSAEHEAVEPGIPWVFFHSSNLSRPDGCDIDTQINLDTGTTVQDFSRVWLGRVRAPRAGAVAFIAEADDGVRLWIGGTLLIDAWGEAGRRQADYRFAAADEYVPMRVEFRQMGGTAHLRLSWAWDGQAAALIPADAFWHTEDDLERVKVMADAEGKSPSAENVPLSNSKARVYGHDPAAPIGEPIALRPGPHLFVDEYLIAESEGVTRVVQSPPRDPAMGNPIVTGKEDGCFQPYMTILRDPGSGRFRLWFGHRVEDYNAGLSHIGYMESDDGVRWSRPARVLADPGVITFGVSVVDDGPDCANAAERFKYAWWEGGGTHIATSPDGLVWTALAHGPVLRHNHDISSIWRDPLRNRYVATPSVYRPGDAWSGQRRVTMQAYSDDLVHWTTPHYVVTPCDAIEEGETQFYAMEGYLVRGDLTIGMVKVLHDDFKADDPPEPPDAYGIGYTALAWSHDGETWTRELAPFFDRNPEQGSWDHAHAWIDEQVLVGDEVFLYYGGYAHGHKVNRFEERQIGLVKIPRDRYVARQAEGQGRLVTPLVTGSAESMTLNVDAAGGEVRVQVIGADGEVVPGYTVDDCRPVSTDALDAPVSWAAPLSRLAGAPVRFEFRMERARLFAFDLK
ncbi:MAG TPA: PA14 domain-containing protein [Candidatus Hydrogenedentes bacterium]|nr:PA14 domain-containing protein [Candidatus Hydrogenedentota bacterium]HPG66296.1 PA14 domain-containing protein [Candidatus Hydrogenedentota bacterium]